jgi:hypothetical protein
MADLRYRTSCDSCLSSKVKCSRTKPSCWRCSEQDHPCVYSKFRRIGRPPKRQASELIQHGELATFEERRGQKQAFQQQRPRTTTAAQHPASIPTSTAGSTVPDTPAPISESSLPSSYDFDAITLGGVSWDLADVPFPAGAPSTQDVPDPFDTVVDFGLFGYATPVTTREEPGDTFTSLSYPLPSLDTEDSTKPHNVSRPTSQSDRNILDQAAGYVAGFAHYKQPGMPTPARAAISGTAGHHASSNVSLAYGEDVVDAQRKHNTPFRRILHCPLERRVSLAERPSSSSQRTQTGPWRPPTQNSTRCRGHCHASLTEQLSRLGDFKSEECRLPFDMLLSLAEHIRLEREKVLTCSSCLGKTRACQTLMLVIMVLENLLFLFERTCEARPSLSSSVCTPDSTQPSDGHLGLAHGFDPHRDESNFGGTVLALPSASPPLMIGDLELDESFRVRFSRHLLRRHLDTQAATARELEVFLAVGIKDSGYKVAAEILNDVYRRIEYFKGSVAFSDGE